MKKVIFLLIVLFGVLSCEDILDKEPLNFISDEVVWGDPALVDAYILQIYSQMYFLFNEFSTAGNGFYFHIGMIQNISDQSRGGKKWFQPVVKWKPGLLTESGGLLECWCYDNIRRMNEFFDKIETSSLPDENKNVFIGRVKYARALAYFALVKRYGGIPLVLEAQSISAPDEEIFVSRNKEVDVYDFIINECDESAELLPETDVEGYPVKYAALALKSRAALYAASIAEYGQVNIDGLVGIPAPEAQRFWETSYNASKEIIGSNKYALYNKMPHDPVVNYQNIFLDEQNNPEIIFAKKTRGDLMNTTGWDAFIGPVGWGPAWLANECAVYLEMMEEFEHTDGTPGTINRLGFENNLVTIDEFLGNKDPRFYASIYTQETKWKGVELDFHEGIRKPDGSIVTTGSYEGVNTKGANHVPASNIQTGFGIKKYLDEKYLEPTRYNSSTRWIVFRYGEILLNYAEAAFELNKTGEALSAVNEIRARAQMPLLGSIDMESIRHERKVELCFEGLRYWDLRRWRIATDVLSKNHTGVNFVLDYETQKYLIQFRDNIDGTQPSFKEKHYYFPITPNRIANNPNLAPENPGY